MENASKQSLAVIVGEVMSSVEFVMDYIQLRFGGPVLSAITHPIVITKEGEYKRGDAGYCDKLIARINHRVVDASATENEAIHINFDDGTSIVISLKPQDYREVEAALFDDHHGTLEVW